MLADLQLLRLPYESSGTLATVTFTILAGASTSSTINLLAASDALHTALYDDLGRALLLIPAPTDEAVDPVDGRVLILPSRARPLSATRADAVDSALCAYDDAFELLGS